MKKILALLVFCSLVISCSKKEEECFCDASIILVDPELGQVGSYTIVHIPSDCEGNIDVESLNLQEFQWFIGTKNCN